MLFLADNNQGPDPILSTRKKAVKSSEGLNSEMLSPVLVQGARRELAVHQSLTLKDMKVKVVNNTHLSSAPGRCTLLRSKIKVSSSLHV